MPKPYIWKELDLSDYTYVSTLGDSICDRCHKAFEEHTLFQTHELFVDKLDNDTTRLPSHTLCKHCLEEYISILTKFYGGDIKC